MASSQEVTKLRSSHGLAAAIASDEGPSLSGYIGSGDVGTWNETWSVGGVNATPNPLTFLDVLARVGECPLQQLDNLLPHRWVAARA